MSPSFVLPESSYAEAPGPAARLAQPGSLPAGQGGQVIFLPSSLGLTCLAALLHGGHCGSSVEGVEGRGSALLLTRHPLSWPEPALPGSSPENCGLGGVRGPASCHDACFHPPLQAASRHLCFRSQPFRRVHGASVGAALPLASAGSTPLGAPLGMQPSPCFLQAVELLLVALGDCAPLLSPPDAVVVSPSPGP